MKNHKAVVGSIKPGFTARLISTVKRRKLLAAVIIVVLLVTLFGVYSVLANQRLKKTAICSHGVGKADTTLAVEAIAANDTAKLKSSVDNIIKLENYQKDSTCLYVATVFYAQSIDAVHARSSYDALEKVYDQHKDWDPILGTNTFTMETLKARVEYAEKLHNSVLENAKMFNIGRKK